MLFPGTDSDTLKWASVGRQNHSPDHAISLEEKILPRAFCTLSDPNLDISGAHVAGRRHAHVGDGTTLLGDTTDVVSTIAIGDRCLLDIRHIVDGHHGT